MKHRWKKLYRKWKGCMGTGVEEVEVLRRLKRFFVICKVIIFNAIFLPAKIIDIL
jgi:hypothetical protein